MTVGSALCRPDVDISHLLVLTTAFRTLHQAHWVLICQTPAKMEVSNFVLE